MKTGIGLRQPHYNYILNNKPEVPWFEIVTENFMRVGGRPRRILNEVRNNYPLAFHGVGLSIGSNGDIDTQYLTSLKKFINEVDPFLVSDHLSWSRHGKRNTYDLLPLIYNKKMLKTLIERVQYVQDFLRRPILLENPSVYLQANQNEYSESEFLCDLSKKSGCGILLDLNNLIVNKHNIGLDPLKYLSDIKECWVPQFHLAGHSKGNELRIDTHDHAPDLETLELSKIAFQMWPEARPMIEWDDKIPEFEVLFNMAREIDSIRTSNLEYRAVVSIKFNATPDNESKQFECERNSNELETILGKYIFRGFDDPPSDEELRCHFNSKASSPLAGIQVYSSGIKERKLEVMGKIFPLVKTVCGDYFDDLASIYFSECPPETISLDRIGDEFPIFLNSKIFSDYYINDNDLSLGIGAPLRVLIDLATFENNMQFLFLAPESNSSHNNQIKKPFDQWTPKDWESIAVKLADDVRLYTAGYNIISLYENLKLENAPTLPTPCTQYLFFQRYEEQVLYKELPQDEFNFLINLRSGSTIVDLIEKSNASPHKIIEYMIRYQKSLVTVSSEDAKFA